MEVWVGTKGSGYDSIHMILILTKRNTIDYPQYYFINLQKLIIKLDFRFGTQSEWGTKNS